MRSKAIGGKTKVLPPKRRPASKDFSILLLELIFCTNLFIDFVFALLKQIVSNSICSFFTTMYSSSEYPSPPLSFYPRFHMNKSFTYCLPIYLSETHYSMKGIIIFNNRYFNIDLTVNRLVFLPSKQNWMCSSRN